MLPITPSGFSFDIVLKLAERCNLACPYCYYFFQNFEPGDKPAILTPNVEAKLPIYLGSAAELPGLKRLNIAFHGGEPLMFPKRRFERLCSEIRNSVGSSVDLSFSIQTNGLLIDDEWVDILLSNGVKTGFSIDGPEATHDKWRPDHMGRGSHGRATLALKRMQQAAAATEFPQPGAIAVLGPETPADLLDYLIECLEVSSPNLNHPRGNADDPTVARFNSELEKFRPMIAGYLSKFTYPTTYYVRGLTDVLIALHSEKGATHNDKRNASRHFIATISSDGSVCADDNLLTLDRTLQSSPFDIFNSSIRDFVESEYFSRLTRAIDTQPDACKGCEWYRSCRAGELFNRFSDSDEYDNKSSVCEFIDMIHEECVNFLLTRAGGDLGELGTRLSTQATYTGASAVRELLGNTK